jgi:hypothetical protein
MSLQDDLIEAANIEVMRRVLEPVDDDDIPDPGIDFDACVKAIVERTERTVKPMSQAKRRAYFLDKARSSMEWCRRIKAPAQITERVEQWLDRLERQWPS